MANKREETKKTRIHNAKVIFDDDLQIGRC